MGGRVTADEKLRELQKWQDNTPWITTLDVARAFAKWRLEQLADRIRDEARDWEAAEQMARSAAAQIGDDDGK
jgi:hypothetical protein